MSRRSAAYGGDSTPVSPPTKTVKTGQQNKPAPAAAKAVAKPAAKAAAPKAAAPKGKKGKPLSKKEQHKLLHMPGEALRKTSGMLMESIMGQMAQTTGDFTMATLKDAGKFVIGIPCPSLAFEYLICNTVVPLEKVMQLYGPRGIGKSGLAFEIHRWFRKFYGIGTYLEHETKFNDEWASSIIGWDDIERKSLGVVPCDSINEWQKYWQESVTKVQQKMTGDSKTLGMGRIVPYLLIVDSIMGKLMQESIDKITQDGSAGRAHPIEAMSITYFLKANAHKLRKWPFSAVTINHLKTKKSESGGPPDKSRTGGQTIDFQGSFELEMSRIGRISTAKLSGNEVKLVCEKNSYGQDKRQIVVNTIWWDEEIPHPDSGAPCRQATIWDWHAATVRLIGSLEGELGTEARRIAGGVSLLNKTRALAPKLGFKKTEANKNGYSYNQIGQAINDNPDMMRALRLLLGIRERKIFRNDIDYLDQLQMLKNEIAGEG